jgi:hypothetical protein
MNFCNMHLVSLSHEEARAHERAYANRGHLMPDPDPVEERTTYIGLALTDNDILALGYMAGMIAKDVEMQPGIRAVGMKVHEAIMRAQEGKV